MLMMIGGATATGKSDIAVSIAEQLNGEIISADSMQIYRHMDVGTAKITSNEMRGIPHHLLDIVEPNMTFSAAQFAERAKGIINEIRSRGKLPIVVGGTGLYFNSLIYEYNMSAHNADLRNELEKELAENGIDPLYERLIKLDSLAQNIHKNNHKRVLRALEVVLTEGKSILEKNDKIMSIPHALYAVEIDRALLYERINLRVDKMFAHGLVDEVKSLITDYDLNFDMQSMQAIGYKEFREYIYGNAKLDDVKEEIKQHSRNYAKRQLTWFKRIPTCNWVQNSDLSEISDLICNDYSKNTVNVE